MNTQHYLVRLFAGLSLLAANGLTADPIPSAAVPYMPKAAQIKPVKAYPFVAGEVKLLDGPFKVSQDADARNLLGLDVERLLSPFITASGGTEKAPPYPGWETRLLPGVALSFYMSGASRMYLLTGDKEIRDRLDYILKTLEECQKRNDGYLLGTVGGRHVLARVEKEGNFPGFGFWGRGEATPYYALEKLMSGLRDVYRLCHDPRALRISIGIGNWLEQHMSHISDEVLQQLMRIEYGGMNWVLADLYADTGDERFLALSRRWHDQITVAPMTRGEDVLDGVHANMQFPKFSGLAARYPYSGDPGDLFGARFFWESVVNHRTYVTGGNSESEYFGPRNQLRRRLTPFTEENCNEYNMLRLTSLLAQIDPKVEYADYCERTLFNHLLAAQDTTTGRLCYFTPLISGTTKYFQTIENFSCCTASGLDSYARPAEYIYSHAGPTVYVNQFIASEVRYEERGIVLRQETAFPNGNVTTLTVQCNREAELDLRIRNPYWADNQVSLALNGKVQPIAATDDGYFQLRRVWTDGDVVEVKFQMRVRTESMPDDPDTVALFLGPVLLAANLGVEEADELAEKHENPALVVNGLPPGEWLRPAGTPLTFVTAVARPRQLELTPFFLKKTGHYSVYWQRMSESQWQQRLAEHQKRKDAEAALEAVTVDKVRAGDSEAEARHNLSGTSTTGKGGPQILGELSWRSSGGGGFGYEMAVDGLAANSLFCRFMGRLAYDEWSCRITIDGSPIQTLERKKDDSYPVAPWHATYRIPDELTRGKSSVKVRFEPLVPEKMKMPRLIELRTVRAN